MTQDALHHDSDELQWMQPDKSLKYAGALLSLVLLPIVSTVIVILLQEHVPDTFKEGVIYIGGFLLVLQAYLYGICEFSFPAQFSFVAFKLDERTRRLKYGATSYDDTIRQDSKLNLAKLSGTFEKAALQRRNGNRCLWVAAIIITVVTFILAGFAGICLYLHKPTVVPLLALPYWLMACVLAWRLLNKCRKNLPPLPGDSDIDEAMKLACQCEQARQDELRSFNRRGG
jgi:hypothetical protein